MSATLRVMRGLPGSGKTIAARRWVDAEPERRARVNRDDLRVSLYGRSGVLSGQQEATITNAERSLVRALLSAGTSVVVDATNLRPQAVAAWQKIARQVGAVSILSDLDTPVDECIARDQRRAEQGERHVGADVITGMAKRYDLQPHVSLTDVLREAGAITREQAHAVAMSGGAR